MGTVHALTSYPIKECAGVVHEQADVGPAGLTHDRLFAVVGPDGETAWQGETPRLATIRGRLSDDGGKLALSAPGAGEFVLDVAVDGPARPVDVDKWPGAGIDQGDQTAEWLSGALGRPVRLVREPDRASRVRGGDTTALLILSLSSLDGLNARIAERGAEPVPMTRFRPNIVIGGWPDPHTEDRVDRMRVGGTEIGFGELAIRCAVTLVDQAAGVRAGPEPLRTLAGYRREPDGVSFGMKAAVLAPGGIAVGDEVTITAWR
ncbi:MOSC domain-containing protein [Amycolatopsis balhimycina DSM 5908]|uniref:MOSC domain-containing protein n=1 Tax=Amycolatopsis balhimycina DSM 5908 TaxID=1081091 RepID=A0A428X117_AMYBA|nr:MOSC N-terminal beta barrel domain-containing protein [Amycolatopsis balhimycina]RSM49009.1 MOSC domain-containing protein [Amycolatopsis balhimycina DSM 5908]